MDIHRRDELRHLVSGLRPDEAPQGFGIAGYRVSCRRDSYAVLESLTETLIFILTVHLGVELASDPQGDPNDYVLRDHVMNQLAAWYRQRFALGADHGDADCVSKFGIGRDWRWWEARILTDGDFLILLDVSGWPCSGLTALRSVLDKCGAESMTEIPKEQFWTP